MSIGMRLARIDTINDSSKVKSYLELFQLALSVITRYARYTVHFHNLIFENDLYEAEIVIVIYLHKTIGAYTAACEASQRGYNPNTENVHHCSCN